MPRYQVFSNGARIDKRIRRNGHTLGEGAVVRQMVPDYIGLKFDVPAGAYVECYRLPTYSNTVFVMWQPCGPIMVKPGCLNLETIGATIDRLSTPGTCKGTKWVPRQSRLAWLALLTDLATYEYKA